MKKLLALIIIFVFALMLAGCEEKEPEPETTREIAEAEKYVDYIRFEQTDADGQLYIYAYYSADHCVIYLTEPDGGQRLYYTDSQVLYDLKDYITEEDLGNWYTIGPGTPELDKEVQVRVEYRIFGKVHDFGTDHMPDPDYFEKIDHVRSMLFAVMTEEAEIQPFTVEIKGKEYHTIRGTGNIVGVGAIIDFGDDKWWQVENFVGHYELTDEDSGYDHASLDILEDGTFHIIVDDTDIECTVSETRGYMVWAEAGGVYFTFEDAEENLLRVQMAGEPYPGTFPGFDLILERIN
ncbi:MAG: hypothetical protein IJM53_05920 [Lachnospiraceae bacterium]|nr:hypothetical protein [Lachnospiraceae bacterium]